MGEYEKTTAWIGVRQAWGGEEPFGLLHADRRYHAWIVGKTGTGKTSLLRNLVIADIEAGHGVGLIDPHGDLAEDLLDYIPPRRIDDVVYFNPADQEFPIGLNLLRSTPRDRRHLVASGVVSVFKSIWGDSWGPRLEYILYASVAALLECHGVSLLGIQRLLVDDRYRASIVRQIRDPIVGAFWKTEFAAYDPKFLQEAIAPIQNKVGQLLMAPIVRNILGQVRSRIDPGFMMDNRRIFIGNLAKGRLGEDKSNLLGALLVASFQLAAMARADRPEAERTDFFLFIDEFHNFSTDSFAAILSEARKYRLCLTLSHQYIAQLNPEIRDAVFGNVGTIIAFRVGEADAQVLSRQFDSEYSPRAFTDLANREVAVRLLVDGENRQPFLGRTIMADHRRYGRRENIIRRSREKYAVPRAVIEDKIARWMEN